jgi:hypothetical protein
VHQSILKSLTVSIFILLIATTQAYPNEPFLQIYEYGQMLYKNPRGIGCHKCHGEHAKGMTIAKYRHKSKQKEIKTRDIRHISYENFIYVFKKSPPSIMPQYRLTEAELQTLHYYITHNE